MLKSKYKPALKIALIYFVFSSIWIFTSDSFLTNLIDDVQDFRNFSVIKGLAFVFISSAIVYSLIKHEITLIEKANRDIDILENYDSLTKLFNRKRYENKLNNFTRNKSDFGIILSDINGLRIFNEAFTYKSGDEILQTYSDTLRSVFVDQFIARLGGDEFVVIIEDIKDGDIQNYIQSLLTATDDFEYNGVTIDISIGFARLSEVDWDINELTPLAESRMSKNKLLQEHSSSNALVTSLQTTLFERSDETEQHARRMEAMCERMGASLNLSSSQIDDLKLLALLHDIGKIGIDDAILKKPAKLTSAETEKMQQHPLIGFRIASTIPQLESISYDILTHHEWYNGEGYPKKLKANDIPLNARILSIVDAFDAMTNDRVYRQKISVEEAFEELIRFKGIQFDAKLVDSFIKEFKK